MITELRNHLFLRKPCRLGSTEVLTEQMLRLPRVLQLLTKNRSPRLPGLPSPKLADHSNLGLTPLIGKTLCQHPTFFRCLNQGVPLPSEEIPDSQRKRHRARRQRAKL
jgi:hypothetical protein